MHDMTARIFILNQLLNNSGFRELSEQANNLVKERIQQELSWENVPEVGHSSYCIGQHNTLMIFTPNPLTLLVS